MNTFQWYFSPKASMASCRPLLALTPPAMATAFGQEKACDSCQTQTARAGKPTTRIIATQAIREDIWHQQAI